MTASEEPTTTASGYPAEDRPKATGDYSDTSKWESRYEEQEGTFDWYAGYSELRSIFTQFCPAKSETPSMLMLGCGNSALSAELYEAGYKKLVNIDVSAAAIKKMQEQFASLDMEWQVMDATKMTFDDSSFDVQIDKGTLDAMMHGGVTGEGLASSMTAEVWRTLRPGGKFILISHNGMRQSILDRAVSETHGSSAQWKVLELRKSALSPQAMLINVLRSKLNGRPLHEGFKDPELLREATVETKLALKQMQFLEAFRLFKAKKLQQQKEAASEEELKEIEKKEAERKPVEPAEDSGEDEAPRDPRRQPFCWVYVLQKPA